jgi:redox-sensitive bicupin YhaK (pirin superfamily)
MSTLIANHFGESPVEMVISGRERDLGGFSVRRILPSPKKRMVGPFIFLDEMGPAEFLTGQGMDVRPHPHIGLSTLTYLFEGSMMHRDSTGIELEIRPGEVNWMTAGRGVVHSERSSAEVRARGQRLSGLQAWVALPAHSEEVSPSFEHRGSAELPVIEGEGRSVRLVAGSLFGKTSPLAVSSPLVYADISLAEGALLPVDATYPERALHVLFGAVEVDGERYGPHGLMLFREGVAATLRALEPSRVVLIGGEPLEGPRHIWWNFVSSSKERIEQAKEDWKNQRFGRVVNDAEEFIPLPE